MQTQYSGRTRTHLVRSLAVLAVWLLAMSAQAIDTKYYIAVDNAEVLASGTYAGLSNPNYGRLTFLFAHTNDADPSTNHFHAISAYSYTGEVANPTTISTNTNNRIPELFTGDLPLRLLPGTGAYAGKLISQDTGEEYSHLNMASVQALSSFPSDAPEGFLFHSSSNRWSTPLNGAVVALQLVSITPKLHIADAQGNPVLARQPRHHLGDGNSLAFLPTFWVKEGATVGTYSVTFKLVDVRTEGTPLGDSGRFTLDFRVPKLGDLDGDNDVDWDDVLVLLAALYTPAAGPYDARDLNQDGVIDAADVQSIFGLLP
jgi:hypothetical protein